MARTRTQLTAELIPAPPLPEGIDLTSSEVKVLAPWVRATEILIRGKARQVAHRRQELADLSGVVLAVILPAQENENREREQRGSNRRANRWVLVSHKQEVMFR
jgi:hypothetical protein